MQLVMMSMIRGRRDGGEAPVALKCTRLGKIDNDPRVLHTSYNAR